MRLAGIVLAILMVAACPPRRGRIVYVHPCPPVPCVPAPVQPVAPPPEPTVKPTDPVVESHLQAWEKKMAGVESLRAKISLKRTDTAFDREMNYTGEILWLKPNYFILRLENANDTTKTDFESYICNGKSLYVYEGTKKVVTEIKLPLKLLGKQLLPSENDHPLSLLKNPKLISERFDVTLFKTDANYIYLDIEPREEKDTREFKKIRLALFGPNMEELAYLPASLYVLELNSNTEVWKFSGVRADIPGLKPDHFRYMKLKGWKLEQMRKPEKP